MNEFAKMERQAKMLKESYPKGTRILLIEMGADPRPIEPNTRGTVKAVDDIGTIHCAFDNGRCLGVVYGEDSFRKLTAEELLEERLAAAVPASFNKYIVCIDSHDAHFTAYNTGTHWNGWECPRFTKEIGLKICQYLSNENCKVTYDEEKDCFVSRYPYEDLTVEYKGIDYNINGELIRLYDIGSFEWTWTKSELNDIKDENDAICTEETVDEMLEESGSVQSM